MLLVETILIRSTLPACHDLKQQRFLISIDNGINFLDLHLTSIWCVKFLCNSSLYVCIPVLLYGLEVLRLNKSQISSIDFVINRFFMKMFNTNNIEIVKCCQREFCSSVILARSTEIFLGKIRQCENLFVKRFLRL